MKKELQDYVWQKCGLPKEFREEVKNIFFTHENNEIKVYLIHLFGYHNLTSDAEGEEDEMLYVSRKRVQEIFEEYKNMITPATGPVDKAAYGGVLLALQALFGSKCLPDEIGNEVNFTSKEPKPTEPKFKVGDKVRIISLHGRPTPDKGEVDVIAHINIGNKEQMYYLENHYHCAYGFSESDLEPYTEPEDSTCTETCADDCSSPGKEVSEMKPIESKISVYLATKEEDEEFRLLLHENGFKWSTVDLLKDYSCWSEGCELRNIHCLYPSRFVTHSGRTASAPLTFSEFKRRYFEENVNLSQETEDCDKQFDNILKDSFRNERRLNIATQIKLSCNVPKP